LFPNASAIGLSPCFAPSSSPNATVVILIFVKTYWFALIASIAYLG